MTPAAFLLAVANHASLILNENLGHEAKTADGVLIKDLLHKVVQEPQPRRVLQRYYEAGANPRDVAKIILIKMILLMKGLE